MYKQKAAYNDGLASRYQAAQTRLRKFEEAGPPPLPPKDQAIRMRLRGGRTGKRAVICEQLELENLTFPFDLEIWYGDRVAVLGANGTGKSHFLRLLAGRRHRPGPGAQAGRRRAAGARGARRRGPARRPGPARALLADPRPARADRARRWSRSSGAATTTASGMDRAGAMKALNRYELAAQGDQRFGTLSGGQQARFLVLLLELSGATLLLLDEPTDNLDLASAEALEEGLKAFDGHGDRGHPRPLVHPVLRPLRAVPGRRRGRRDPRAGLGRALASSRHGPVRVRLRDNPRESGHRAERGADAAPDRRT